MNVRTSANALSGAIVFLFLAGAACAGTTVALPASAVDATDAARPASSETHTTSIPGQARQTQPAAVLSDSDVGLYRLAFTQIDTGQYDAAEATLTSVTDRSLAGYVRFHKLFSRNYVSTYDELVAWMRDYGDLPMAMRVWNLAKRKKPDGAPDPDFPSLAAQSALSSTNSGATRLSATVPLSQLTTAGDSAAAPAADLTPKSARSAYNNGQLERAYTLGQQIGDHWVAGLAAWRLERFEEALIEFNFVATDPSSTAWSRSGGAYWAGRASLKLAKTEQADTYFKIAASYPFTFYGLVAEERLGVTPAVTLARKGLPPTFQSSARDGLTASLSGDYAWVEADPKARRMTALVQVGRAAYAGEEARAAMQASATPEDRNRWLALASTGNVVIDPMTPQDSAFNAALYPTPDFGLRGGYGEAALVYAISRKESKFNPRAKSYAGAYGLMQIMPATAALIDNNPTLRTKPDQLLDAATNIRVGRAYIKRLLATGIVDGDLVRVIGSYNAGPRPVQEAVALVGEGDALLLMESIPVAQTRQYVEEVTAAYWIYRQMAGKSSRTLALAAQDAAILDVSLDR